MWAQMVGFHPGKKNCQEHWAMWWGKLIRMKVTRGWQVLLLRLAPEFSWVTLHSLRRAHDRLPWK